MGQDAFRTWASVFRAVANEQEWAAEEEDDCISKLTVSKLTAQGSRTREWKGRNQWFANLW
jgi:hypothetical protein